MPAARPPPARRRASARRAGASPSSACTRISPVRYARPSRRNSAADVGQRRYFSAFAAIWYAEKRDTGKPRLACSVADAATSANDIVPQRPGAASHAAGAAGTTVRARPGGIWPPCRSRKYARLEARGYGPTPDTWNVAPVRARCTRIGATPATLTMSGCTTPSVSPAATPASIALPPASSTRAAASEASAWPAATAQRGPIACTVAGAVWRGAVSWWDAESRLMAAPHDTPGRRRRARGAVVRSSRDAAPARRRDHVGHGGHVPGARLPEHGV